MPPFNRLDHVQLAMPAGEEELARTFYVQTLGFTEIAKPPELARRGGLWLRSGDVCVHLGVDDVSPPAKQPHPSFRSVDHDGLVNHLRAFAITMVVDDDLFDGMPHCYLNDPFGNRLELIAS